MRRLSTAHGRAQSFSMFVQKRTPCGIVSSGELGSHQLISVGVGSVAICICICLPTRRPRTACARSSRWRVIDCRILRRVSQFEKSSNDFRCCRRTPSSHLIDRIYGHIHDTISGAARLLLSMMMSRDLCSCTRQRQARAPLCPLLSQHMHMHLSPRAASHRASGDARRHACDAHAPPCTRHSVCSLHTHTSTSASERARARAPERPQSLLPSAREAPVAAPEPSRGPSRCSRALELPSSARRACLVRGATRRAST